MSTPVSRRQFVRTAAGAAALFSAPLFIPSRLLGAGAPSNRIRVGHIGCGRIASGHDMPGVFKSGLADIAAVCDLDSVRAAWGKRLVEKFYRDAGATAPEISVYGNYLELLARKDIDAVTISLPDHQHAEVALGLTEQAVVMERGVIAHRAASAALLGDHATLDRYLGLKLG